jgi:hypothetical protein
MEVLYAAMNIVGPVLLLLALIYFSLRQWKSRPREEAISDEGARRLREELNREDNG